VTDGVRQGVSIVQGNFRSVPTAMNKITPRREWRTIVIALGG